MQRRSLRRMVAPIVAGLLSFPLVGALAVPAQAHETFDTLVFTKTDGYRHASIADGIDAIKELGEKHHFSVTATENASAFTYDNLKQYETVIWLSTTGNVLDQTQQAAFKRYIKKGGGYVGVHAAADTEYDWEFYGKLVGAYFTEHPSVQEATVNITDQVHPSTKELPKQWVRTDEWYNYRASPRGDVHVLASLEESSYDAGPKAMGPDHPISWCQLHEGGRSWYTGMGHTAASYSNQKFLNHLLGGIMSTSGEVAANCGGTEWANYDQVTLAKGIDEVGEPQGLAVLPNGDVLHTDRGGNVFYTTYGGDTSVAAQLPVYHHDNDGLFTIAIDPNFAKNRWVYLFYSPPLDTPSGNAPDSGTGPADFEKWKGYNRLSRFKLDGKTLDLSSEQEILKIAADRGQCCHTGGDIAFGPKENLFLSTGDDSNPFQSSGYAPLDERRKRNPAFDAQRSSGNTNDLRGKLLRINVQADGSYTIPDGNLFAGDGSDKTRGEIYAMGFRNPYRYTVDQKTGTVYLGEYAPDASSPDPDRGPGGIVEFNRITAPGFYGWPYCTGENIPYHDYNFATGESGPLFDCAAGPTNESFRNNGMSQLPPAKPAWLPYNGDSLPDFGSGSESPMGGPVYRFDKNSDSKTKFPAYFNGKFFAYEFGRGWIKTITIGDDGQPVAIDPFFPTMNLVAPFDVEFGPDGSLYVLDYGSGWYGGSEDSAVYRIDYVQGSRSPNAEVAASPTSGQAPLEVEFSGQGSNDPDPGDTISYAWDFDGDGKTDSTKRDATYTYTENGEYIATLTVTDSGGKTGTATARIVVGNTAPKVTFQLPKNGQMFSWGDKIPYKVEVTDPDGVPIDCSKVKVEYILGHSTSSGSHGHPLQGSTGCEGVIQTSSGSGHSGADIYGVLHASYTDTAPVEGVPGVEGEAEIMLQPKHKQAEFFADSDGIQLSEHAGAEAGTAVGHTDPGDWISFSPMNVGDIDSVSFRVASPGPGGTIEVHAGSPDGPLVAGPVQVSSTGGWESYTMTEPVPVTDPGGTQKLYLVFKGEPGTQLFDVDSITFHGDGAAGPSDSTAPQVSPSLDPPEPNGDPYGKYEGTYNTPVTVSLEATDRDTGGSGVSTIEYKLDGGDWAPYDKPVKIETAGEHTLTYRATDGADNVSKSGTTSFEIVPDACPGSDIRDTVIIGERDSGVDNRDNGAGCTVNDLIEEGATYESHGAFVDHVEQVVAQLVKDGLISGRERGAIMQAAARSDIAK